MKKIVFCLFLVLNFSGCGGESAVDDKIAGTAPINLAETRRGDHVDTYFGVEVADPYRWLEDDLSDETAAWIGDQNSVTRDYLSRYRDPR